VEDWLSDFVFECGGAGLAMFQVFLAGCLGMPERKDH
jgi:hypothetical protein